MRQGEIVVVFDIAYDSFLGNRIFDPGTARRYPGATWLPIFKDMCKKRGYDFITSDILLANYSEVHHGQKVFLISEMVSTRTNNLLSKGVIPLILSSGESPNVAVRFYDRLSNYTGLFKHAIMFGGAQAFINRLSQFHQLFWPNSFDERPASKNWATRKFLVMVAGNKSRRNVNPDRPLKWIKRAAKPLVFKFYQAKNPLFRFKDLYPVRMDAIRFFAQFDGFELFGTGWDDIGQLSPEDQIAIRRLKPMPVKDKLELISNYKFALCFENCVFPGYVTEKIFDCLLAGCIPVYFGAPDITDFVPKGVFIDYREYRDFHELARYLKGMSELEATHLLEDGYSFLSSDRSFRYREETFANQILTILESEMATR